MPGPCWWLLHVGLASLGGSHALALSHFCRGRFRSGVCMTTLWISRRVLLMAAQGQRQPSPLSPRRLVVLLLLGQKSVPCSAHVAASCWYPQSIAWVRASLHRGCIASCPEISLASSKAQETPPPPPTPAPPQPLPSLCMDHPCPACLYIPDGVTKSECMQVFAAQISSAPTRILLLENMLKASQLRDPQERAEVCLSLPACICPPAHCLLSADIAATPAQLQWHASAMLQVVAMLTIRSHLTLKELQKHMEWPMSASPLFVDMRCPLTSRWQKM